MSPEILLTIRYWIVVLKWPNKILDQISLGEKIMNMITASTYFPVGDWPSNIVTLVQFTSDVAELQTTQANFKAKTGSKQLRDAALAKVFGDCREIMPMVQKRSSTKPLIAQDIILSAGYSVKTVTVRYPQQNAVYTTEISGTILATAEGAGGHNWQITQDQKIITTLEGTKQSHVLIPNLVPGQIYFVRNKKQGTLKQKFEWTAWIQIMAR